MIEMEQRTFPVFSSFSFQLFGLEALDFFVDEYSWSSQEQLEVLDQVRLEDVQSEHQRHLGFRFVSGAVVVFWLCGFVAKGQTSHTVGSFSSWQGSIHNR